MLKNEAGPNQHTSCKYVILHSCANAKKGEKKDCFDYLFSPLDNDLAYRQEGTSESSVYVVNLLMHSGYLATL